MSRRPIVLVLGGARSGKSRFALERAARLRLPRVLVATAEARDPEMAERIARHRAERGALWRTIEEPRAIAGVLRAEGDQVIVIDCLTLWLANVMGDDPAAPTEPALSDLLERLRERRNAVVLVSNELGSGIVPETALARAYRDAVGFMNQKVAEEADEVFLVVAGQPLRVK